MTRDTPSGSSSPAVRVHGDDHASKVGTSPGDGLLRRLVLSPEATRSAVVFLTTTVVLIAFWQTATTVGWVSEVILPQPSNILDEILFVARNFFSGTTYWRDAWVTLQEILLGFALATSSAVILGSLVSEVRLLRDIFMPYVVAMNSTPKVAFVPVFVVWLGFGMAPKVVMAAFIAFFPVFVNVVSGLQSVSREQVELMRSLRATRWQTFSRLKFPSALTFIFPALRVAMALSIIGAIIGEFSAGAEGIGYLITLASSQVKVDQVFAFIILLSVVGYVMFGLLSLVERRVVHWQGNHSHGS